MESCYDLQNRIEADQALSEISVVKEKFNL
jgi:hypothetical protein